MNRVLIAGGYTYRDPYWFRKYDRWNLLSTEKVNELLERKKQNFDSVAVDFLNHILKQRRVK
jgi:hypothetical protein